jgi:hypothetical protein
MITVRMVTACCSQVTGAAGQEETVTRSAHFARADGSGRAVTAKNSSQKGGEQHGQTRKYQTPAGRSTRTLRSPYLALACKEVPLCF